MSIQESFRELIFPHMHPEAAIRYLPIVELLKKENLQNSTILEIGSGSYGITPYLKKRVTGLDNDFSEPETKLLKQIKGTGKKLPFKNNEFEAVILSDVLEHIDRKDREETLREAVRVCSSAVIISGPFGNEAASQDRKLAEYSLKRLGVMHHFFKEHLEYGLPEIEEVESVLKKMKKVRRVRVAGSYFNLKAREWLMRKFLAKTKLGYYFYLKGLMPAVPILRRMNNPPTYRTVILAEVLG